MNEKPEPEKGKVALVRLKAEHVKTVKRIIRHYDLLDASEAIRKALEVTGKYVEKQEAREKEGKPSASE